MAALNGFEKVPHDGWGVRSKHRVLCLLLLPEAVFNSFIYSRGSFWVREHDKDSVTTQGYKNLKRLNYHLVPLV